ncbi:hypothetical protein [Amycolatopsis sp. NPDC004625]|uniref:hypothetical protein n=1 Tax=Amycolatopsis sp. NPDC004625 TaxID=3154670 RepID=UPI0033B6C8C1
MTAAAGPPRGTAWETLAPWEKATEWHAKAPHIADEVMALAREQACHQRQLELDHARHQRVLSTRIWITQLITLGLSIVNMVVIAILAWHSIDTGNFVPTLTVLGAGAGLTAGTYGVSRSIAGRGLSALDAKEDRQGTGA